MIHLAIEDDTPDQDDIEAAADQRAERDEHVCERCRYRAAFGLCADCEWWLAEIAYAERRRCE